MTEISIAGAILNPSLVLPTGKAALPIKAGQANVFKAKAGEHYGSLKKKDVEEPLLDNVVAKPAGEDAKPVDAEGTRLTLESAVIQAPVAGNEAGNEAATEAAMPGQLAQGYPPSAQGAAGAALSEGNNLGGQVFAYAGADAGAGADALQLAQADTSIKSDVVASGPADPVVAAAGIGPLGILGIVGLGLGAAAAAGGSSAPTVASIDTLAPTVTNTSGAYTASTDTLVLTGTNYNTLLEAGETAATDIKARLDWTKLSWDINGDNAATDDVSFVVSDISSAKVTDGTHLTIVLASTKGTSLEATSGYGGTTLDTLDVTAGFARDAAGNAATTDTTADGMLTPSAFVAGDAVIDLGSYGKLIAPVQVDGGQWYYHWDRSGDGTSADTGSLNGGVDYTTHDVLDGIFTQDIGGTGGGGQHHGHLPLRNA